MKRLLAIFLLLAMLVALLTVVAWGRRETQRFNDALKGAR